jgi:O-methyltransferase involved in polyketide biosynthesis
MARPHPETISPTAHYTGYVWYAHGQSHDAFATSAGRFMYRALRGPNVALQAIGWPTLEGMLVARHRVIDLRLHRAIASGEISQIVEVAAGLSPRGWRFRKQYGDRITYIEADLPGMRARKQEILARLGGETPHHRTAEVNALVDDGPTSIGAICASLDRARGTAIITEGLVNYFDRATTVAIWKRFARALAPFPRGLYLSDLVLRGAFAPSLVRLLGMFVRGRVHLDFASVDDADHALDDAGFDAALLDPCDFAGVLPDLEHAGAARVRIVEAIARRLNSHP